MNLLVLTPAPDSPTDTERSTKGRNGEQKWKGKPRLTLSPLFLLRVPTGSFSMSRRVLPGVTAPWTTMVRSTVCPSVGVWTCVCEVGVLSVPSSLAAGIHTTSWVSVYRGIKCVSLWCVCASAYGSCNNEHHSYGFLSTSISLRVETLSILPLSATAPQSCVKVCERRGGMLCLPSPPWNWQLPLPHSLSSFGGLTRSLD